jgi:type IX secretion system PorP/SprF family membrane protein
MNRFSMKKVLLTAFLAFLGTMVFAQQEAIYNQYNVAPILVNPAAAGFDEVHTIQLNARGQWLGFPDAPKNFGVQYHGPLGKTFGFGMAVMGESAAQISSVRARLNAGFRFKLQENVKLSIGFSTDITQFSVNNGVLNGAYYEQGDDIIENAVNGQQLFDASLAGYIRFYENTYIGLSLTNLIAERLRNIGDPSNSGGGLFQHYVLMAGHKFELSENKFSLEPSVMVRSVMDSPFNVDVNLKAGLLDDKLIAGLSYRSLKTIGVLAGTELTDKIKFFYTFDLSMQDLQQYSTGSHEISLILGFKGAENRKSKFGRR